MIWILEVPFVVLLAIAFILVAAGVTLAEFVISLIPIVGCIMLGGMVILFLASAMLRPADERKCEVFSILLGIQGIIVIMVGLWLQSPL